MNHEYNKCHSEHPQGLHAVQKLCSVNHPLLGEYSISIKHDEVTFTSQISQKTWHDCCLEGMITFESISHISAIFSAMFQFDPYGVYKIKNVNLSRVFTLNTPQVYSLQTVIQTLQNDTYQFDVISWRNDRIGNPLVKDKQFHKHVSGLIVKNDHDWNSEKLNIENILKQSKMVEFSNEEFYSYLESVVKLSVGDSYHCVKKGWKVGDRILLMFEDLHSISSDLLTLNVFLAGFHAILFEQQSPRYHKLSAFKEMVVKMNERPKWALLTKTDESKRAEYDISFYNNEKLLIGYITKMQLESLPLAFVHNLEKAKIEYHSDIVRGELIKQLQSGRRNEWPLIINAFLIKIIYDLIPQHNKEHVVNTRSFLSLGLNPAMQEEMLTHISFALGLNNNLQNFVIFENSNVEKLTEYIILHIEKEIP